jgi:AcrR family transcriptional regulator
VVQALSRRDRVRAATVQEIKQTARRLLVEHGPDAATLRAIAREMGMTAPGLYRYFDSHEELIKHVIADLFSDLADDLHAAIDAAGAAAAGQGDIAELTAKMVAVCREFRRWALEHKAEYSLLFGTPLPGIDDRDPIIDDCGRKFGGTFFTLFFELWQRRPFPVPAPDEIDPGLRQELERYRDRVGAGLSEAELPAGTVLVFLRCWARLYGAVTLEAFDHLRFALDDASPMFEYTLAEMAAGLGLTYPPGSAGAPAVPPASG